MVMIKTNARPRMPRPAKSSAALFALLSLGACTATTAHVATGEAAPSPQAEETITIAVGPCFGFCPVYEASITPNGTVTFNGQRHTEVLGERTRASGQGTYRSLSKALAPYRPTDGTTARVKCTAAITDTSTFTITWINAAGRKTVATHHSGCAGGLGGGLDKVLDDLPGKLGIADWAKQLTRAAASRG